LCIYVEDGLNEVITGRQAREGFYGKPERRRVYDGDFAGLEGIDLDSEERGRIRIAPGLQPGLGTVIPGDSKKEPSGNGAAVDAWGVGNFESGIGSQSV
jgi:hypothetical protein